MANILVVKLKGIENDYRDVIRDTLSDLKEMYGKEYNFQKIANFCKMQPAYLSFVFAKRSHLNGDQMWGVCEFLKLSAAERFFLSFLAEYQQSNFEERQKELAEKVLGYEREMKKIKQIIKEKQRDNVEEWYHLDPLAQFVKQYVTLCPEVAQRLDQSAAKIGLSSVSLRQKLGMLEKGGLIEREGELYKTKTVNAHVDADDSIFSGFFKNRLSFGVEQSERVGEREQVRFSVMFTADSNFQALLEEKLRQVISWASTEVNNYNEEQVYVLNIHHSQLSK
ncbi:MAG: hypothetical protein AB8C84_05405 [Oligoflexales bacterium]